MPGFKMNVSDGSSEPVKRLMAIASPKWRTRVLRGIGRAVQNLCRDHLIVLAGSRHGSAGRLGATPTGILGQAAEQVNAPDALTSDDASALVSVKNPALARVGRDVDIYPGTQTPGVKFLTIPANAAAYGHRYNKGANKRDGAKWFFVKHVHQKQDRTLLPSDDEITRKAKSTLADYVEDTIAGLDQSRGGNNP